MDKQEAAGPKSDICSKKADSTQFSAAKAGAKAKGKSENSYFWRKTGLYLCNSTGLLSRQRLGFFFGFQLRFF